MSDFDAGTFHVHRMPPFMRIGALDYRIEPWAIESASSSSRFGECDNYQMVIRVSIRCGPPARVIEVFLHEVMHAIYHIYDLNDDDKEERICNRLGYALTALYRDNPWLLGWIDGGLRGAEQGGKTAQIDDDAELYR